jgi:hypothetical protein
MRRILGLWLRLLVGAVIAATPLVASTLGPATASASAPPYVDPNVSGSIGLCDQAAHQITSGSVDSAPFVWSAVSSVPPPRGYGGDGRTAVLSIYQPRRGVDPGEWSGQLMTSSSRYTNAAHPMTVATGGDLSLADYLSTFPASWDGYLQLRLYVGIPGEPQYTQQYPATDIQVTGDTWRIVRGGAGPCGVGTAESLESRVLPGNLTSPTTSVAPTTTAPSGPLGTNPAKVVGKAPTGDTVHQAQASAPEPAKATSSRTSAAAVAVAGVAAVVLVGAGAVLWLRRRSRSSVELPTSEEP